MARKPPAVMTKGASKGNIRADKKVSAAVVDRSAGHALKSPHSRDQNGKQ